MEKDLLQLEATLRQEIDSHQKLARLIQDKLAALRRADHRAVTDLCRRENELVQVIGELDKIRLLLAANLTRALDPAAARPLRLADLCQRLPEPARGRLLVLRLQLREQMEAVGKDASLARRATESLVRHMQGLLQSIGVAVTGVGLYTRSGNPHKAALAVSTFQATG